MKLFLYVFFQEFYNFTSYLKSLFWLDNCVWWISSFPKAICWKDYLFPIVYFLLWQSCQKSVDHICVSLFPALYFVSLVYMSIILPVSYYFNYCSFVICFKSRKCKPSSFVLLPQDCFAFGGSFFSFIWEWMSVITFYFSVKNANKIMIETALNL